MNQQVHTTRTILLALAAFLAAAVCPAQSQDETGLHAASGTITVNGKTMDLKSAIAVWNEKEKAIVIGLFPFQAGAQDAWVVQESGVLALAAVRPSPDESVWTKTPAGGIVIRYKKRPKTLVLKDVRAFSVRASWLDDPGKTHAIGRSTAKQFAEEISEFGGNLTKIGGEIHLLAAGSDYLSGVYMDWNIRVDARVYAGKKQK